MTIENLILTYHTYIYNFALKLSCHPTTAEDLTQETFIQAWTHLDSLENPNAVKAWLRKICFNQFLMQTRKQKSQALIPQEDFSSLEEDSALFMATSPTPEEEVLVAVKLGLLFQQTVKIIRKLQIPLN